ncbi:MAG: aromatic aminobenezylarsenical efflux permease ArsG family transporter [Bacteroidales bacterium]|nr:aromatic aminobenezylarsenical efflux permease ArsG family transporter [Bacteroidales bacterium]
MDILTQWLESTNIPIISAFILGIMTAISPCPLTTNITAIGFISKDLDNRRRIFYNGLWYTLGRVLSYMLLAFVLYLGASTFHVARFFQSNGERYLGFLLILIGFLMLDIIKIQWPKLFNLTDRIEKNANQNQWWSALLLGMIFALAFCPYSGALFFGMLIPLTISNASGLILPVVFAIATSLPVIIVAFLLAFSISSIGNFYKKLKNFEYWFRRFVAIVFIAIGIYYVYLFYFK